VPFFFAFTRLNALQAAVRHSKSLSDPVLCLVTQANQKLTVFLKYLLDINSYSHNELIELIMTFGCNELIEHIMAFGRNELIKPNDDTSKSQLILKSKSEGARAAPNQLSELIVMYPIGLIVRIIGLVGHNGLVGRIVHNGLVSFIGLGIVGFVGLSLDSLGGLIGHISLVSCCIIGLIELAASSNHWPIGLIGVIGLGLIALSASTASLARRLISFIDSSAVLSSRHSHKRSNKNNMAAQASSSTRSCHLAIRQHQNCSLNLLFQRIVTLHAFAREGEDVVVACSR
jgi:hypothetical protein